jgi:hypothetical protein
MGCTVRTRGNPNDKLEEGMSGVLIDTPLSICDDMKGVRVEAEAIEDYCMHNRLPGRDKQATAKTMTQSSKMRSLRTEG